MKDFLLNNPYIFTLFTFVVGAVLMPFILAFAKRYNLVVRPNRRTSHNGSVPNIGGANIFLSLLPIFVTLLIMGHINPFFFVGFCLIFVVGFIDDVLVLSAYWKILAETLCAICLIYFADIRIHSLYGIFGVEELPLWASYALSYFVYMLIINAINLVDGVDGLASSLAIIYNLFFGIWFMMLGESYLSLICFAAIGVLTIFFIYNVFGGVNKKIFMGDSGSLTIGYMLVFILFLFLRKNQDIPHDSLFGFPVAPAMAIAVFFVPVFDVVRVSLTRLKKRKSILEADRNHIHHLLLRLGLSHREVTFVLDLVSLFFIVIAILLKNYNFWVQMAVILIIGILMILVIWQLINRQIRSNGKS